MKIKFDFEKLELGDTIEFYSGRQEVVERIEICPCGNCNEVYINNYPLSYRGIKYLIKKKEVEYQ